MEEVKVVLMVLTRRLIRKEKDEQKIQYFANTFGKREATKGSSSNVAPLRGGLC